LGDIHLEIRNPRGNCKTGILVYFRAPFPLTPALSLREREPQWPVFEHFQGGGFAD